MKWSDIMLSILIIMSFFISYLIGSIMAYRQEIINNWDEHKCNPMIMPFASWFGKDAALTFTTCIAQTQKTLLTHFLGPIEKTLSIAGNLGGSMISDLNNIRNVLSNTNFDVASLGGKIFADMFDMRGAIAGMLGQAKLIVGKVMGAFATIIYIMRSMLATGQSTVDGPIGDYFCFKLDTTIQLNNGKIINMKDAELGDKLMNGTEILGILKLKNHYNEPFYKIYSEKLNKYIYVTGGHLIYNEKLGKFSKVKYNSKSIKTNIIENELTCLITKDNKIPMGEYIFWDWED